MKSALLAAILLATTVTAGAQTQKYGVTATGDAKFNFTGLKTYVWTKGQPSIDQTVDAQITAAVDRELAALGLTKRAAEPGDVLVSYASQRRTDVDLKAKPNEKGASPQYSVGVLLVAFIEPGKHRRVLDLRMDTPIDTEPAKLSEAIDAAVAAMFAKYPTRQPLKK